MNKMAPPDAKSNINKFNEGKAPASSGQTAPQEIPAEFVFDEGTFVDRGVLEKQPEPSKDFFQPRVTSQDQAASSQVEVYRVLGYQFKKGFVVAKHHQDGFFLVADDKLHLNESGVAKVNEIDLVALNEAQFARLEAEVPGVQAILEGNVRTE